VVFRIHISRRFRILLVLAEAAKKNALSAEVAPILKQHRLSDRCKIRHFQINASVTSRKTGTHYKELDNDSVPHPRSQPGPIACGKSSPFQGYASLKQAPKGAERVVISER
jgi:hypothetical protein